MLLQHVCQREPGSLIKSLRACTDVARLLHKRLSTFTEGDALAYTEGDALSYTEGGALFKTACSLSKSRKTFVCAASNHWCHVVGKEPGEKSFALRVGTILASSAASHRGSRSTKVIISVSPLQRRTVATYRQLSKEMELWLRLPTSVGCRCLQGAVQDQELPTRMSH